MILTNFFDDLPQLTDDQVNSYPDSFEWWYFDMEDKIGNSIVVLLKRKDTFTHKINPSVYVEYTINGKKDLLVITYPKDEFRVTINKENAIIYFGDNFIDIRKNSDHTINHYKIFINFHILRINAKIIPIHQGFKPSENGVYFTNKKKPDLIKCVNFAAPRIKCEGVIDFFQEEIKLIGDGYHDHPWGTSNLLQTNSKWYWGRLFNEKVSLMYADVTPHNDYEGNLKFLYYSLTDQFIPKIEKDYQIENEDWKKEPGSNLKFPHSIRLQCPKLELDFTTKYLNTLLNIKIYNRSKVNFELRDNLHNFVSEGTGWIEYWNVPTWMRGLLIKMNRNEQAKHVKKTLNIIDTWMMSKYFKAKRRCKGSFICDE